jgi:hypothetical protein
LTDEAERSAEIIRLFPSEDEHDREQPARREPEKSCVHRHVNLNRAARIVTCRDCGNQVDAFTILDHYAGEWDRVVRWHDEAKRRARVAHERLEEILRLERNARARLRRVDPAAAAEAPAKPYGDQMFI